MFTTNKINILLLILSCLPFSISPPGKTSTAFPMDLYVQRCIVQTGSILHDYKSLFSDQDATKLRTCLNQTWISEALSEDCYLSEFSNEIQSSIAKKCNTFQDQQSKIAECVLTRMVQHYEHFSGTRDLYNEMETIEDFVDSLVKELYVPDERTGDLEPVERAFLKLYPAVSVDQDILDIVRNSQTSNEPGRSTVRCLFRFFMVEKFETFEPEDIEDWGEEEQNGGEIHDAHGNYRHEHGYVDSHGQEYGYQQFNDEEYFDDEEFDNEDFDDEEYYDEEEFDNEDFDDEEYYDDEEFENEDFDDEEYYEEFEDEDFDNEEYFDEDEFDYEDFDDEEYSDEDDFDYEDFDDEEYSDEDEFDYEDFDDEEYDDDDDDFGDDEDFDYEEDDFDEDEW